VSTSLVSLHLVDVFHETTKQTTVDHYITATGTVSTGPAGRSRQYIYFMVQYCLFVLKVPLNTNKPTKPDYGHFFHF